MQTIREIHHITSNTLTIPVPTAFKNGSVEIIMLPLDKVPSQRMLQNQGWRDKLARAIQIRTQIAARRNKKPLTPTINIINQIRDERNERFDNLR